MFKKLCFERKKAGQITDLTRLPCFLAFFANMTKAAICRSAANRQMLH